MSEQERQAAGARPAACPADTSHLDALTLELLRTWRQLWRTLGQLQRLRAAEVASCTACPLKRVANMAEPVHVTTVTITKLTDAASALFSLLYVLERAHKAAAKERLRTELMNLDVFANSTLDGEPDDWPGR
jgi:hypothetical protein